MHQLPGQESAKVTYDNEVFGFDLVRKMRQDDLNSIIIAWLQRGM